MNAAAMILAVQLTHAEAISARPDAPVVPVRERGRRQPLHSARHLTARALRKAAERLEPAARRCA